MGGSKRRDIQERNAAAVQHFAHLYARKAQPGRDPNDRRYDRKLEEKIKRMKPEQLGALLKEDTDD
jgi:hypothetical protein